MSNAILAGLVLGALFTAFPSGAAVYKCTDKNGQQTFSGQPCATNAQIVKVQTHTPSAAEVERAKNEMDELERGFAESSKLREAARLQEEIRIKQRERDNEIAMLRERQATASNNLAGAEYYSGLATEMQAVTARYQGEIEILQKQLADVRSGD